MILSVCVNSSKLLPKKTIYDITNWLCSASKKAETHTIEKTIAPIRIKSGKHSTPYTKGTGKHNYRHGQYTKQGATAENTYFAMQARLCTTAKKRHHTPHHR
ncbi:MAG: hypothetical protein ABI045_07455 [Flavobacteriales bacterium]